MSCACSRCPTKRGRIGSSRFSLVVSLVTNEPAVSLRLHLAAPTSFLTCVSQVQPTDLCVCGKFKDVARHLCTGVFSYATATLRDSRSGVCLALHNKHSQELTSVSLSCVVSDLVVSADKGGAIIKWHFQNKHSLSGGELRVSTAATTCVACCPDNAAKIAIGCQSGAVFVMDITSGLKQRLQGEHV
jgi:WD40 repeat protein